MPPIKHNASDSEESDWMDDESDPSNNLNDSSSHLDIFNALVGPSKKRPRIADRALDHADDDAHFIQACLDKRDTKAWTPANASKSRQSQGKGNSSGGSFQSMGEFRFKFLAAFSLN